MKDFNFQPFDKVLARDEAGEIWHCDFFSHVDDEGGKHCVGAWYDQMIPYNEDTKHLIGTTKPYISPEEAPKFEFGDVVEFEYFRGSNRRGIFVKYTQTGDSCAILTSGNMEYPLLIRKNHRVKLIRKGDFNG